MLPLGSPLTVQRKISRTAAAAPIADHSKASPPGSAPVMVPNRCQQCSLHARRRLLILARALLLASVASARATGFRHSLAQCCIGRYVPVPLRANARPAIPCAHSHARFRRIPCTSFLSFLASRARQVRPGSDTGRTKLLEQNRTRAIQPRPHRSDRALEQRRGFGVALAFQIAQRHGFPVVIRQCQYSISQQFRNFARVPGPPDSLRCTWICGGMAIPVGVSCLPRLPIRAEMPLPNSSNNGT